MSTPNDNKGNTDENNNNEIVDQKDSIDLKNAPAAAGEEDAYSPETSLATFLSEKIEGSKKVDNNDSKITENEEYKTTETKIDEVTSAKNKNNDDDDSKKKNIDDDNNNEDALITQPTQSIREEPEEKSFRSNLIVNYLPPNIGDTELRKLFELHGQIESCRVIRNKVTQVSLGYGFVKFSNDAEAATAISSKNGLQIANKRIKVSIARPPTADIKNCKLYISSLPVQYGNAEVMELFSKYGKIIECRVLTDQNTGQSRGIAFIQYDKQQEAQNACDLNGKMIPGATSPVMVKFAEKDQFGRKVKILQDQIQQKQELLKRQYGVNGGNQGLGDFGGYGPIKSRMGTIVRGNRYDPIYGVTNLSSMSSVGGLQGLGRGHDSMGMLGNSSNPYDLLGLRNDYVSNSQSSLYPNNPSVDAFFGNSSGYQNLMNRSNGNLAKLYVAGLPPTADETFLHFLFSKHGDIVHANVITQPGTKICKGYGFVTMQDEIQGHAAIQGLNNTKMGDTYLKVSFKKEK